MTKVYNRFLALFAVLVSMGPINSVFALDAPFKQDRQIYLEQEDALFVKYPIPKKGIVCSNRERALRLAEYLTDREDHVTSWGPFVVVGNYKGQRIFIGGASVGTGSGLLFTELFAAGAKYVIRYGSDDVKSPPDSDAYLVKVIDEADSLIGFEIQSGIPVNEAGRSIPASPVLVDALVDEARAKNIVPEKRVCHHLENYHGLRASGRFSLERRKNLEQILSSMKMNSKPASFDMETAVLFRVAKDFGAHAATVLQTVDKQPKDVKVYDTRGLELEKTVFAPYVLDALLRVESQD